MCPVLSAPQNGTIDCSLGDDGQPNPGDFCLFACDDGFVLSRSDRRTCLESGAWSGLETACREGWFSCLFSCVTNQIRIYTQTTLMLGTSLSTTSHQMCK